MNAYGKRASRAAAIAACVVVLAGCGDGYGAYKNDHLECKMAAQGTEVDLQVWRKDHVDAGRHAAAFARVCAAAKHAIAGDAQ